jgi:uncharacterized membrane protein
MHHPHPFGGGGFGWGYGPGPGPESSMFLSTLGTIFWIAMLVIIVYAMLRLILPYVRPLRTNVQHRIPSGLTSLDLLRERYIAGEIDAETFAQVRERLVASYGPKDIRPVENVRPRDSWSGHKDMLSSPVSYEQVEMMEQRQYLRDTE